MKYERQFTETVDAERIPEDPKLSDLERLRAFTGCHYTVESDATERPTIVWHVHGRVVFSEPGNWITKDADNCLTWWEDADFRANFHEIEPSLEEVLQKWGDMEMEWLRRPPVVAHYG